MRQYSLILSIILLFALAKGAPNGLSLTPAMGWNSWASYGCNINESVIYTTIDQMVALGLPAIGYKYVNLDDCWQGPRDANGTITADPKAFPYGIKPLADYAHKKGLKFGIYSSAGVTTCAGRPGSLGYEHQDAKSYENWGIDYLKYDNCPDLQTTSPKIRYPVMSKALAGIERPILYSVCEWGIDNPDTWASTIANSWRTTDDLKDNWDSMLKTAMLNNLAAAYAKPGGWNDPDQLQVGNGGMKLEEYRAHFSLWSIMKAPLLISTHLQNITQENLSILTNREVIAVNQDKLGKQGKMVFQDLTHQVWIAPLSDGSKAVLVVGVVYLPQDVKLQLNSLFGWNKMQVRDLWTGTDLGTFTNVFVAQGVPRHGCRMFKMRKV